jgi:murein L,D-transpeptidase YcbB/YkuD
MYRTSLHKTSTEHHAELHVKPLLVVALAILFALALCGQPLESARLANQPAMLSLELNIPAFRLDVREDSTLVRSFPVAVGMRAFKTPTGDFEITQIIWNPWWYPPDAEWAAQDTVTPPGPGNPMGKVKLMFNGPYYMHGTPLASSIGHAASHGCVRMRNADAIELATIVQTHGGASVSAVLMDSLMSSWNKTRFFTLATYIPVTIVYRTAEVRDFALTLYPDVYRRQRQTAYDGALAALINSGIDSATIDTQAVRRLARRLHQTAVSLPLESLLRETSGGGHL